MSDAEVNKENLQIKNERNNEYNEENHHENSSISEHSSSFNSVSSDNFLVKLAALEKTVQKLVENNSAQNAKLKVVTKDLQILKEVRSNQKSNKSDYDYDRNAYKIYVGNIPVQANMDFLIQYFSKYGKVCNGFFFREFETCKNAFVSFIETDSVEKVLSENHYVFGKRLNVGRARNRNQSNKENVFHNYKLKQTELKQQRYRPY